MDADRAYTADALADAEATVGVLGAVARGPPPTPVHVEDASHAVPDGGVVVARLFLSFLFSCVEAEDAVIPVPSLVILLDAVADVADTVHEVPHVQTAVVLVAIGEYVAGVVHGRDSVHASPYGVPTLGTPIKGARIRVPPLRTAPLPPSVGPPLGTAPD